MTATFAIKKPPFQREREDGFFLDDRTPKTLVQTIWQRALEAAGPSLPFGSAV